MVPPQSKHNNNNKNAQLSSHDFDRIERWRGLSRDVDVATDAVCDHVRYRLSEICTWGLPSVQVWFIFIGFLLLQRFRAASSALRLIIRKSQLHRVVWKLDATLIVALSRIDYNSHTIYSCMIYPP
uniref:(northern house mosquito) hypothetical protein n=1 Tax=Culex pipiens TaxID=7175 RepID=A0A8D8MNE7_CULPI